VKLARLKADSRIVLFWCPGCKGPHQIPTADHPKAWKFNEEMERPTLAPSILITTDAWQDPEDAKFNIPATCCHSFVRDGQIQFLSDCTHELAGKTVELPELPESWRSP
jgi:hypothetical protein